MSTRDRRNADGLKKPSARSGLPIRDGGSDVEHPGGRRNQAKSATRALDVLEYFAMVGHPLRAIDISHAFDFHPSSTDQLLKTMVDYAYLLIEPVSKRYYPSPRLVNFGHWLSQKYYGQDHLYALMKTTYTACEQSVTLALRHGSAMQIVDVIEPPDLAGSIIKGQRVPIIGSALGAAFLAAHPVSDTKRILKQIDRSNSGLGDDFIEEISSTRSRGHASGGLGSDFDLWSLAVALPRPSAGVQMVLGIAGGRERLQQREAWLIDHVRTAIGECLEFAAR